LEQKGFDYEPCHGKYQGDKQPSYIVHVRDDSEDETLKGIARRMGQESVVHSEGGKHQLVYLNGENKGKATAPSAGLEWYGDQEPDDNYTTLYGASGEPLGHFQYTMDFDNPMVPDGPGPMVDVPEAAKQVLKSAVESYRGILLDLRKRESEKLSKKLNPGMGPDRDTTGPHSDESSLALNRPSHPFSDPKRATTGGAISGSIAKYIAEGHARGKKARAKHISDDISAQGPRGPSSPHSTNVVASAPKTHKTETPMKLHDLMKAQAERPHYNSWAEAAEANGKRVIGQDHRAKAGKPSAEHTLFEESDPKVLHPSDKKKVKKDEDEGKSCPNCQGKPSTKFPCNSCGTKKSEFPTTNKFSNKLAAGREQSSAQGSPAAAGAKSTFTQRATTPSSPNAFKSEDEGVQSERDSETKCRVVGCHDHGGEKRKHEGREVKVCGFHAEKMDRPGGYTTAMRKAQCSCGGKDCKWCGGGNKPKQSNEQGEHGGSPKKPSYQPGDETKKSEDMPMAPVVKNSIFKKMPEMNKAQTNAHASAKRNGGTIKLGKQEFYIDHQNPTAPQKDDKTASIPGGKETGWQTGGQKPKVIEHSASGGAISANKPKAGPDQKNTSENSVTEGTVPKSSGKNDLIEKGEKSPGKVGEYCDTCDTKLTDKNIPKHGSRPAKRCESCVLDAIDSEEHSQWASRWGVKHPDVKKAASDFHKRTGGRFLKPKKDKEPKPSPEESALDEGRHNPQDFEKAAPAMGAPKAPSAGGAGSPTLSGGAPAKPPTAHAGANQKAFGKAESWVSTGASQYDSSLAPTSDKKPTSGLFTKPELNQPPPGTGVTPMAAKPIKAPGGFRSPAQHTGIKGFLGKQELCKGCGKSHKLGKCA